MVAIARSRSCDKPYYGVCEGIVHEVDDPDKLGRVRVSFPWFDEGTIFKWCRVMQYYAGGGYGAFFVPEIGDEVIVGFIHGDMRLPIVLGGLYNGKDKPPSHRDKDKKDEKLIRTKGGHRILMNDSKDKHQIEMTTAGGHMVDLSDADEKIYVTTSGGHILQMSDADEVVSLVTSGGHSVNVDDGGQVISVDSAGGHSVVLDDGAGSITISTASGQTIVLDQSSISISANASVTLKASSIVADSFDVKLGGQGASQMALLGTMFLQLFNAHTHASPLFGIPTSPPIVPAPPAVLSLTTKVL